MSVTVSDGSGDATDEADVAVTVPPVAALAALAAGLRSFDAVTLDASGSSDPDGSVATYAWDLDGDGRYDHTDTVAHLEHPRADRRHVHRAPEGDRRPGRQRRDDPTAHGRQPPADGRADRAAARDPRRGGDVRRGGSADLDGHVTTYDWTFGDGGTATTTTPTTTHVYAANGTPTAKVKVTDDAGATAEATLPLKVTRRPVAALTADPLSGRPGDQISLSAAGSADPDGGPLTYAWSYTGAATCDGTPSASDHTTVTFLTFGTKRVTVCAIDADGAVGIAYATIAIVNDPPVASFTATPDHVATGQVVTFDASASSDPDGPLASLRWDLDGDGSYETSGVTASRSYANPGTFTVALLVKDSDGARGARPARSSSRRLPARPPIPAVAPAAAPAAARAAAPAVAPGRAAGPAPAAAVARAPSAPAAPRRRPRPSARCSRARPSSASRSCAATAWARPSRSTAAPA